MTHSWMAALLVTVPPCPLCNPGNPRQGGALLVLGCCARQRCRSECGWWDWHGTSTPVRLQRWRSRWGFGPVPSPCWALPTNQPTYQLRHTPHSLEPCEWASSTKAENRSFPQIRPLDPQPGWRLGCKLTFYCSSRFGFELRKRLSGAAAAVPTRIVPPPLNCL